MRTETIERIVEEEEENGQRGGEKNKEMGVEAHGLELME